MDIHKLDYHAFHCKCKTPYQERIIDPKVFEDSYSMFWHGFEYVCEKNPQYFLFQLGGKFHLIIFYRCIVGGDERDFFTSLLKESVSESKGKRYSNIKKSVRLDELVIKIKKGDFTFKNYHEEVIHIYNGSFGVPFYCITRLTDYFQTVFSQDEFRENYKIAKEKLKELDLFELLGDKLTQLFEVNLIHDRYYLETQSHKAIDSIIKHINKIANGND